MQALQRTFDQYRDIYKSLSAGQRGTLIVVAVLVVGTLGYLMSGGIGASYVPASLGKSFTPDEMQNARQALRKAGLSEFRIEGQQILVPGRQVDRYNAALLEGGGLPDGWASELDRQLEKDSIFSPDRNSQTRRDIALASTIRRILLAIPEIEDAGVIWARSKPRSFSTGPKVTATVSLLPRSGRELALPLIQSVRNAVANMVPDLKPENVVVFDQSTATSHTAERDGAFDGKLLSWIEQHRRACQANIEHALAYIPDVRVTVTVDNDSLQSRIEAARTVDPNASAPAYEDSPTHTERSPRHSPRAERGAGSNVPKSLDATSGSRRQRAVETRGASSVYASPVQEIREREIAAMPRAVQVSVAVPEDYFHRVAVKRGLAEGQSDAERREFQKGVDAIRAQVLKDVEETVALQIPAGAPDAAGAIHVTSYVPLETAAPAVEISWTETVGTAVVQWGGAAGLGLFALFAVWMLVRSTPQGPEPDAEQPADLPRLHQHAEPEPEPEDESAPPEINPRDEIRSVVRDNPELAAAVLSRWLQAAK